MSASASQKAKGSVAPSLSARTATADVFSTSSGSRIERLGSPPITSPGANVREAKRVQPLGEARISSPSQCTDCERSHRVSRA
jgi:hypothetical protein